MAQYRKLGRTSDQRKAMLRSLTTALLTNGKIVTTEARAKEVKKQVESLIALAGLYRCSTDYLLGLEKSENVSIDASMLTDEQKRLLQYFLYGLK